MEASVDPQPPGSRLDADYPENGVLIPRRNTLQQQHPARVNLHAECPFEAELTGIPIGAPTLGNFEVEERRHVTRLEIVTEKSAEIGLDIGVADRGEI